MIHSEGLFITCLGAFLFFRSIDHESRLIQSAFEVSQLAAEAVTTWLRS